MKRLRLLATLLLASYATVGTAVEYVCRHGDASRSISVEYEIAGQPVPCRVRYEKAGVVEYPWTVQAQTGFCEDRVAYLATRLGGFGWTCTIKEEPPEQLEAQPEAQPNPGN
ncbi:MAG: hypothetical protein ACR2P9_04575 [Gammaproteobacteria bacterium]